MASKARREREAVWLRQEIMAAARELFASEGFENVSMRKIAVRIEYSPTTIYLYYKDKAELLHEICETAFAQLSADILESWMASEKPIERLRLGMLAYINFGLNNPYQYEIVFISPKSKHLDAADYSFDTSAGKTSFELLIASVKDCMEGGAVRQADLMVTAQTLWAGIHGVTSLLITHPGFPFKDRQTLPASVVDTLIAGIK